jgi:hypothetical protein
MNKLLITSGCSFSECITPYAGKGTWPNHLIKMLPDYTHISYAMGSQGNGLISRGIIYGVCEALKTYKPEDILVGVMWSGSNRHDFRCENPKDLNFVRDKVHNGWIKNPTSFVKDGQKNWVILNVNWTDQDNVEAETHYRMFHSDIGSSIYSIEHILRTQYFLKQHNIRYFFTDYMDDNIVFSGLKNNIEIKYLLDLIDKDQYLPVTSEYSWILDNTKFPHLWTSDDIDKKTKYEHPKYEMHKEFVEQIVYPWIQEKGYLSTRKGVQLP